MNSEVIIAIEELFYNLNYKFFNKAKVKKKKKNENKFSKFSL